jgi:predicted transcriptional regulator
MAKNGQLEEIEKRITPLLKETNLAQKKKQAEKVKKEMEQSGFWQDKEKAQRKTQELSRLEAEIRKTFRQWLT